MDKNEAIKIIRSNYPTGRNQLCEALETLIPELKESEDERIRKELLQNLKERFGTRGSMGRNLDMPTVIAWFEKKGEKESKKTSIWNHWKDGIAGNGEGKLIYLIKDGDDYSLSSSLGYECDYVLLSDLDKLMLKEKQGKQKPIIEGTFVDVDEVRENFMQEVYRVLDADSTNDRANQIIDAFDHLPTITIQKPTDKVEPKFKIGDWIVSNRTNKTYKIDSIDTKDANYIIYSCVPSVYTNEDSPCFSESMIHLWTIQDAKDGDVLAFYSEYKGNRMVQVGIIKKYVGKHGGCSNTFNIYVGVNWDNNLQIDEYMGCSDIRPATKEQRDLLFVKLKEAGYEWDVEKKELKKIEQKSTWS